MMSVGGNGCGIPCNNLSPREASLALFKQHRTSCPSSSTTNSAASAPARFSVNGSTIIAQTPSAATLNIRPTSLAIPATMISLPPLLPMLPLTLTTGAAHGSESGSG